MKTFFSTRPPKSIPPSKKQQPNLLPARPFTPPTRPAGTGIRSTEPPPVQTKVSIRPPGDKYEQEADQISAQVVDRINSPATATSVQGAPIGMLATSLSGQATSGGEILQAKSSLCSGEPQNYPESTTDLASAIDRARGNGKSLDARVRQSMGRAMGSDFSRVKIHTGAESDRLNRIIRSKAFTTRNDIFFSQGAYRPENRDGQGLIAHELAHVEHQRMRSANRQVVLQLGRGKRRTVTKNIIKTQKTISTIHNFYFPKKKRSKPRRPPSNSRKGQGDHIVSYALTDHAVDNAIKNSKLDKFLGEAKGFVKPAPINSLWHKMANNLISTHGTMKIGNQATEAKKLINMMPGTAIKNKKSTKGHGEGGHLGGLEEAEKKLTEGKIVAGNPMANIMGLIDLKADNKLLGDTERLQEKVRWLMTNVKYAAPTVLQHMASNPRTLLPQLDIKNAVKNTTIENAVKKFINNN